MIWEQLAGMHVLEATYDGNLIMRIKDGDESVVVRWEAEGDCCSSSWIEHIEGVENLTGQTILSASAVNGPVEEDHPEYECLRTYFYKLVTTAGYLDIDMRNSSNGYYGGSLTSEILGRYDKNGKSLPIGKFNADDVVRYVSVDVIENYRS